MKSFSAYAFLEILSLRMEASEILSNLFLKFWSEWNFDFIQEEFKFVTANETVQ